MTHVFHPHINSIVPWQAEYTFPSQATQVHKQTVKIQPKNASSFVPSSRTIARIEFPSDGYWNALNSVLTFDLSFTGVDANVNGTIAISVDGTTGALTYTLTATSSTTNNQYLGWTVFLDGGLSAQILSNTGGVLTLDRPLVPIRRLSAANTTTETFYKCVVSPNCRLESSVHSLIKRLRILYGGLVLEDIQEYATIARLLREVGVSPAYSAGSGAILSGEQEKAFINGGWGSSAGMTDMLITGAKSGCTDSFFTSSGTTTETRTVAFQPMVSGLLTQRKLIPLKWMAAQFVLELEFHDAPHSMICGNSSAAWLIENMNYLCELHEFDSLYDTAFFDGMRAMGVPLLYTSWAHQTLTPRGSSEHHQIHLKARSLKAAFGVFQQTTRSILFDTGHFYHDLSASISSTGTNPVIWTNSNPRDDLVSKFQWRVGGKYFPAQPVECLRGGAEAYIELQKAINTLGDYNNAGGVLRHEWTSTEEYGKGGHKFCMAVEFEHADVFPNTISGINSENQSDLAVKIEYSGSSALSGKSLELFMPYDCLLFIHEGNRVELVM